MQHETYRLVQQLIFTVQQMETWIDKAEADAEARGYKADTLLQARLTANMFPLMRQYASALDNAKLMASRLTTKAAPSHPDDQTTWAQVRTRLNETRSWMADLTEADFSKAAEVQATFSFVPGKYLEAETYAYQFAVPNFYFHAAMAYAILRQNGVPLGKSDYLGPVPFKDL